jgi:CRISPR-associated protein Cmr6
MPAAVPVYLKDFSDAPPGHRFSLYYAGWNSDWSKPKNGVVPMLDALKKLPEHSIKLLAALCARQNSAAEMQGEQVLALPCISTAPFATGLGNEHPLENGFAFLTPYGLPYLAGSGIKGVIRTAAEELASGEWSETQGWNEESIRALFGPGEEDPTRDTHPQQGVLRFWDVLPILHRNEMSVEIMTPHHGEYYQQGKHGPYNSESPNPISFLAVPARSKFTFFVECNAALLRDDTLRQTWRNLLEAAFDHAGKWLGFGAKTTVGYGRMMLDEKAIEESHKKKKQQAHTDELALLSPNLRRIEEFKESCVKRFDQLLGNKESLNGDFHNRARKLSREAIESASWTQEEKSALADVIAEWLPKVVQGIDKDQLKKMKLSALSGLA